MQPDVKASKWHVAYTMPNSERKVVTKVSEMGLETFLPVQKVIRQWSDRCKKLEIPLFPNYVFVKVGDRERAKLLSIRELVKFVSIEKKPVVVRDELVNAIRQAMEKDLDVNAEQNFQEGVKVRVASGQFAGLRGIIVKKNGKSRLIIRIEGFEMAVSFNLCSTFSELTIEN